jgi:hypothetical protein
MGHLRTGTLPITQKWRSVVTSIGTSADISGSKIADIAEKTLDASNQVLRKLPHDQTVQSCFQFLVTLSVAGQSSDVRSALQKFGIIIEEEPTKLQLSRALRNWLNRESQQIYNPESASLARKATVDTIATWINKHLSQDQKKLFSQSEDAFQPWKEASNGGGFCELSRIFFANFTTLYLNYFLSRTASSQIQTITERERFAKAVTECIDTVSNHAFETSKIVQSFSAGWFNKYAIGKVPPLNEVEVFLRHSFEKIREALSLEKETT